MREVEVKFRVRDVEAVASALRARGVELGPPVRQQDQAYAPMGWTYGENKIGVPFVRLRAVAGRSIFTLKRPAENVLSCEEFETAIADGEQMHQAILAMGFRPTVRISKVRRVAVWDGVSFCVDEVAGVGVFLELERVLEGDVDGEKVQAELVALVAELGIVAYRTDQTYDSLVRASQPSLS